MATGVVRALLFHILIQFHSIRKSEFMNRTKTNRNGGGGSQEDARGGTSRHPSLDAQSCQQV